MNPLSTGLDLGADVGFDIAGAANRGYVAGQSGRSGARLYTVDVTTGKTRQLGRIGGGNVVVTGLAACRPVEDMTGGDGSVPARPRRTGPGMSANPSVISRVLPSAEAAPAAGFDDEAALVARLATGDREEALTALYNIYGRRLYALGIHLLHDRGLAEDLVQETFVRLWRSANGTTPAGLRFGRSSTRWRDEPPSTCGAELERAVGQRRHPGDRGQCGRSGVRRAGAAARRGRGAGHPDARPPRVLELQYHGDLTQAQSRSGWASRSAPSRRARCTRCVHSPRN